VRDLLERLVTEMVDRGIDFEDGRREFDKAFIGRMLQKCDGNLGKAADKLGMHRNTLARKIHELQIKASRI
jgi:DNA-binding NtrC family response regulator